MEPYLLSWGRHRLKLGPQTCVMGVVNVTPDSFSDGGQFLDPVAAVSQAEKMAAEGAGIIDIGGESTRPFSDPITTAEEIDRVVPVIETLANRIRQPISIDTMKAAVARRALAAGAAMINDISAMTYDPEMVSVARACDVPVVLMHMRGTPKTMQAKPRYTDVTAEVCAYLLAAADRLQAAGVARRRIILDPGIGFGKTFIHNLLLLKHLQALAEMGYPLLVGTSRKSFIRRLVKGDQQADIHPEHPLVETGTQATVTAAILAGAQIIRVHDVANTMATVKVIDAIRNADG
ncbi:MAG: dihydropteroate synthase [Desulfobacterales bacterium]